MTDISALGIKVTSDGVVKTTGELERFAKASNAALNAAKPINIKIGNSGLAKALADIQKLDRATRDAASSAGVAESAIKRQAISVEMAERYMRKAAIVLGDKAKADKAAAASADAFTAAQRRANAAMSGRQLDANVLAFRNFQKAGTDAFKLTAHEGLNFSRQMADIGVTAAMGMNPMMIALQQGPQLFDIMQQAGVRTGKSIGQVFAATARQYAPFIAGLGVAAVAVGTLAVAWNTWLGQVNDEKRAGLEAYAKSLGLTKDQIEAAGGAAITSADMIGGLWDEFKEVTGLDQLFKDLNDTVNQTFNDIVADAKKNLSELYAAIYVVEDILDYVGKNGGKLFAEGLINGINAGIRAINDFGTIYGPDGKPLWTPNISEIENNYEGAGAAAADAFSKAVTTGYEKRKKEAQNAMDAFFEGAVGNADQRARKRFEAEAENRKKASDKLAERLERERKATEALIEGNLQAAAAYGISTAAGKMAEVQADANEKAIRKQIAAQDKAAYVNRELRKYVSEQARSYAENNASLREQIAAQQMVNKAVESGALSVENASIALGNMIEQRKILNAIELAKKNKDGEGEKALRLELEKLTKQQIKYNAEVRKGADLAAADSVKRGIPQLQKEIELERKLGKERMKALRGLSGDSLENELARINNERERSGILLEYEAKIADATAKGHYKLVEALEAERKKRLELLGVQQGQESDDRTFEQNRRRAISASREMADIIGGSIGDAANAIMDAVDKFEQAFGKDVWGGLGEKFAGAFKVLEKMGAGAKIGGAVDGIFDAIGIKSSKTGAQLGGAIGQFAGPLGAIAGSIAGGLIGGMLKSTPRASATVSIIAGEAMDSAIKGNKAGLKKIAGGLADSVISGLSGLADQLGAQLVGDARVSIGIRDKNYRVDPTGQGITKTKKGAIDFGDDQASAVAYAIQIAIQQGVLGGLSESMKRLIMADGDLQTQIQKALSFKSVFDDLAQRDDPAKWAQDQVTAWHDSMAKIFAEAGATADELAELERLTGIKRADAAKEAADKIAQAERDALERQNAIRDKNIELLTALGKVEEAEAMARAARIADAPDYLRALQEQIEAANVATRAAEEAAAAQKAVADQAHELALAIADLENPEQARLMRLADERALYDDLNLAAFDRLQALKAEAEATAAAAQAAEELAQKNKAIADEVGGLQRQWLELIGDTKTLRQMDLAGLLSDEARALQQRIWAFKDTQDALKGEIDARNDQISAINSTISALSQASQRWSEMAANIREFRASLFAGNDAGGLSFEMAQREFQRVASMARLGDEGALQSFTGTASNYLDAAMRNASSLVDYQRAIGLVAGAADAAAEGADGVARQAAQQLSYLYQQVGELEALNAQSEQQIEALNASLDTTESDIVPTLKELLRDTKDANETAAKTREEEKAENISIINLLSEQNAWLRRVIEGNGLNVNLPDVVNVTGNVNVANTPLPVDQVP